jgi:hypothetical protein
MAKLGIAHLDELHAAIVSAHLVRCRGQLLMGVDDSFVCNEDVETSLQIRADLERMNAAREPSRRRALATWLRNAVALAGARRVEAEVFSHALAGVSGHSSAEGEGAWVAVDVIVEEIYASRGVTFAVLRYVVGGVEHLVSRRDPDPAWREGHVLGGHFWSDDASALSFAFDPEPSDEKK